MSYLAGPAVRHEDGRPEVSRTGVDRILPSRPVQGSWQLLRRALRGPLTVENTGSGRGSRMPKHSAGGGGRAGAGAGGSATT